MASFKVTGGSPLNGSIRIGGAKNASFKVMIASLLANSESRLLNFSQISDVELVAKIIAYLGCNVSKSGERSIFIDPTSLSSFQIDPEHGEQGRFSTIFIPALLHKFGKAEVPTPGGDRIGARPLDRHFDGLEAMGAKIKVEGGMYVAEAPNGLVGAKYRFAKNTHTGTETLIMAATKAKGTTILENAALEPEVDDLIEYLNKMGARIERKPNRVIKIEGVNQLQGAIHKIMPDRNEAVSYACAAIATKGDVIIENAQAKHLRPFLRKLSEIGAHHEIDHYGIRFYYQTELQPTNVTTEIEPGFMTDWQPLWATLATQCHGDSIIHETIYPDRFQYVDELTKMGAKIEKFNPKVDDFEKTYNFYQSTDKPEYYHAIKISGPSQLQAGEFTVKDLRHGATLILAAMTAQGTSTINNIELVDRGYESLDERLRSIGAQITRVG